MKKRADKKKIEILKDCLDKNMPVIEIVKAVNVNQKEFYELLSCLIKTEGLKVFRSINQGLDSYASEKAYIENMGYKYPELDIENNTVTFAAISDLHMGSTNDRIGLIKLFFEFCEINGIEYIINLGDLTEGLQDVRRVKRDNDFITQASYINLNLPRFNHGKHILLQGNHDIYMPNGLSNDLIFELNQECQRTDLVYAGFEEGKVLVGNNEIILCHVGLERYKEIKQSLPKNDNNISIILRGHSHKRSVSIDNENIMSFRIPALSNISHCNDASFVMGFDLFTLHFDACKKIDEIMVERYIFDDERQEIKSSDTMSRRRVNRR